MMKRSRQKQAKIARTLPTIGWREWVALPNLGIDRIKAKVDTGARTSSLHAFDVDLDGEEEGAPIRFKVHPIQRDAKRTLSCESELVEMRWVRSSNGRRERRPVIETEIELLGARWSIELTLTTRDVMGFRMLLGRQAVRGRYLIHPGRSFLAKKNAR